MYLASIGPVSGLNCVKAEVPHDVPGDVEVLRGGFPRRRGDVVVIVDEPAVRCRVGPEQGEIHSVSIEHRDIRPWLPNRCARESPPADRVSIERVIDRRDARPRGQVSGVQLERRRGRGWDTRDRRRDGGAQDSGDDEYRNARSAPDHALETPGLT